ncbi:sulfotransferase [Pseudoalteromonas sp. SR45-1]|uniref:tetratricopeptide repeat-containing sulfotransferase family protein n=1 Tax=Pseudoalteromonas sp. SR45-1 TaxID=2760932 RepID=UPI001603C75D|nr:sulfotransferase [Pseudoalteromonas sp. SR45-1]MBB1326392.1 sulfotransferase [Pseudoalteromonas sp. SR45-1]
MLLEKANQLLQQNKLKEAEFHFKAILNSNPENGEALFGLGRIALRLERYDAAVYLLQKACERLPHMLEPLHALADAFNGVHSPNDALTVLEYAKKLASHNPEPHYYLAQHYLTHGELDKAHTTFAHALSIGVYPVTAYILFELVQLGRFDKEHNYVSNLHHLLTQTSNLRLKMVCYYALANSYDALEDTKQAFNYFILANKLQKKLSEFNTRDLIPFYDEIIKYNTEEFIASADKKFTGNITPVFIIGMPRSGSTLVEQILASHSQFSSLGESTSISNNAVAFIEQKTGVTYPQCLAHLTPDLIKKARELYITTLKTASPIRPFIINKLPSNYQSLGLIYILFPNAKFINLSRDFNATAFSIFTNYFAENEPYFCSLPEFKLYHKLYEKLMSHWHSFKEMPIYDVSYEDLVSNPKEQLTQLLGFLNCSFEERCLAFYKQKTPVTTLSKHAIRQPINNAAIAKWERYKTPLLKLLDEN